MPKKSNDPDQFNLFEAAPEPDHVSMTQPVERLSIAKDVDGATARDLLPPEPIMTMLNGSTFSASEIARALRAFSEAEPSTRPSLAKSLGIPSEKASILSTCARKMMLVVEKAFKLTPFGNCVLANDPYLDSIGTLWLLHYILASNARLVSWSQLFDTPPAARGNHFGSTDVAGHFVKSYEGLWTEYGLTKRAKPEIGAVINLYIDNIFTPLKLIAQVERNEYRWISNPAPVPALVLLASALIYRDRYYPGATALEVSQLVDLHFAPGRIMGITEPAVRKLLDELHARRLVTIETRANLDQIRFKESVTWLDAYSMLFEGA